MQLKEWLKEELQEKWFEKTLEKGTMYWDPKNKAFSYVLGKQFASGKSLLVGKSLSGKITTVYPLRRIPSRLIELSEDVQKVARGF